MDALTHSGENGSQQLPIRITVLIPVALQVLKIVPRFPGSLTLSIASQAIEPSSIRCSLLNIFCSNTPSIV